MSGPSGLPPDMRPLPHLLLSWGQQYCFPHNLATHLTDFASIAARSHATYRRTTFSETDNSSSYLEERRWRTRNSGVFRAEESAQFTERELSGCLIRYHTIPPIKNISTSKLNQVVKHTTWSYFKFYIYRNVPTIYWLKTNVQRKLRWVKSRPNC